MKAAAVKAISLLNEIVHFTIIAESSDLLPELEKKLETYRHTDGLVSSTFSAAIRKLHYALYDAPQLKWDTENEASKIGISSSYFQHLYRKYPGISFKSDIISARMTLAEQLLKSTTLNVNEIAEKCGYSDHSHFMKLFKKKKGITANAFRKNASLK